MLPPPLAQSGRRQWAALSYWQGIFNQQLGTLTLKDIGGTLIFFAAIVFWWRLFFNHNGDIIDWEGWGRAGLWAAWIAAIFGLVYLGNKMLSQSPVEEVNGKDQELNDEEVSRLPLGYPSASAGVLG